MRRNDVRETPQYNLTLQLQSQVPRVRNLTLQMQSQVARVCNLTLQLQSQVHFFANLTLHLQSQVSNPGNLTLHLQSQVSNPEISENDFSRILSLNKHTSAFRIIILILSMVTKRCRKLQSKYVSLTRSVCWDQSINAMQLFFN
jgi:hypothetical protein